MTWVSAIYRGEVTHVRVRPKRYRLRYGVAFTLLDLDELAELDRNLTFFGYNRARPVAFRDKDHTLGAESLRDFVRDRMSDAGVDFDDGPVRLLCLPRLFGYAFKPLSVFFCYRRDETLAGIIHDVRNTHSERHTYAFGVEAMSGGIVRQSCDKEFYVSPFLPMGLSYRFTIEPPGQSVSVGIKVMEQDKMVLAASFRGSRVAMSQGSLSRLMMGYPLQSLRVIGGIHWEAVRMWLRGFRVYGHRPALRPRSGRSGAFVRQARQMDYDVRR